MKIAIDSGPLTEGHAARGVGIYVQMLYDSLNKLSKERGEFEVTLIDFSSQSFREEDFDILHYPFFDFYFHTLPLKSKVKRVVTVHDTIPLIYPDHYPAGLRGRLEYFKQKKALYSVDHILTVSETSKKDIVRFLGINEKKIAVVYNGPTISATPLPPKVVKDIRRKYSLPAKYILYVGDVNWNKNLLTLCQAAKLSGIPLVIVGKSAVQTEYDRSHVENQPLYQLQNAWGGDTDIKRLGYVPEEDLRGIYDLSFCYCQSSWYEGFGLPVLDALYHGIPTIIAKNQALVELFEEVTLTFKPSSVDDLVRTIELLNNSQKLRLKLSKSGKKHALRYSWELTAQKVFSVYKSLFAYEARH